MSFFFRTFVLEMMRSQWFRYMMQGLLDVIYPPICPMCGRVLRQSYDMSREIGADVSAGGYNSPICASCYRNLPRTEQASERQNETEMVFYERRRFRRGAAFLFFEKNHPVQKLVHAMKFARRADIAYYCGTLMAEEMLHTGFFDDIDVIIPVPLHAIRYRERGYNQSEYIARGISDMTGIPVDMLHHVQRIRATHQQARTAAHARETNVAGAFRVNHPEELYRKHILIVDDLVTTGATISAVMDALTPVRGALYSVLALGKAIG